MNTFRDNKIELMLNRSLKGKAPDGFDWKNYYRQFKRVVITPRLLAARIWEGYSFTPCYQNGRRIEDNFDVAYHIGFDFDEEGAGLDYLMRPGSFADLLSSFAYSTPSSTEDHPKSRVIFILPDGITSPERFRKLYQAMAFEFEKEGSITDKACKDSLRLYFGSVECQIIPNWSAILEENVQWLIERYEEEHPPPPPVIDNTVTYHTDDDTIQSRIEHQLNKIVMAPDGEKHHTLNKVAYTIGGYVGAGHISKMDAISQLDAAITTNGRADDVKAARRTIETAVSRGIALPLVIENKVKKDGPDIL